MSDTITSESENDVKKFLRLIIKNKLSVKEIRENLFKNVPGTVLSKKMSIRLITFVLDKHKIQPTKCKLLLQYCIGLLEYNLINYEAVDLFYYKYYKLLNSSGIMTPLICKLIYMLTKDPRDLKRILVIRIKKALITNTILKPLTCLLMIIKSLRSDILPERIPARSTINAFRSLPIDFRNNLEKIKLSHTFSENVSYDIKWGLSSSNKKDLIKLIPDLSLVNVESLFDKNFNEKTLIEYDNLIELQSGKCSSKNIGQSMALLNNFAGIHFLTHEYDVVIKTRLIYSLQHCLRSESYQFTPTSIKNQKELFISINNLYNCAQQGIPQLSNCVLEYFYLHKNVEIDHILLNLLTWTVINSFEELHKKLLVPFIDIFTTRYLLSDQLDMINCLSDFIVNFVITYIYPEITKLKQPFPLPEGFETENHMEIFRKLCLWINIFSVEAMKLNKEGLLGSILNLHHIIYNLQTHLETFVICAASPCVVYACMSGLPFYHVDSCCKLLLRYMINKEKPDANEVSEITKKYTARFSEILNGSSLKISSDIPSKISKYWKLYIKNNKLSYGIHKNLFLMPYVVRLIRNKEEITFDIMLDLCEVYYPNIHRFFKEISREQ